MQVSVCESALQPPYALWLSMQGYQHPAVRRYWLAILIHAVQSADAMISSTCASALHWFLWHFTASAVPEPLRPALRKAADIYRSRMVDCSKQGSHRGWTQPCMRRACTHRFRLKHAWALQWLLASDSAMEGLPAGTKAAEVLPVGAALAELHGNMLGEVSYSMQNSNASLRA